MMLLALSLLMQNDAAQANGRDNAWENAWVSRSRDVYTTTNKTAGMVIHVGDSITHANPYGSWARGGSGKSTADGVLTTWINAGSNSPTTAANTNGFWLCAVDVASRSMTAAGGITTAEYLSGDGNGGPAMPSTSDMNTARSHVENATYTNNLHITTVASAFANAQFAIVMLGTNDFTGGRQVGAFIADLGAIVDALEAREIVVILSTIPPCENGDVSAYNTAIRNLAQTGGHPLIDYYAEILARRSGATWQDTLIGGDGVHPSSGAPDEPYLTGGNPDAHLTGDNCLNDGYLLRGWLSVQKLKEVRSYVADNVNPPGWVAPGGGGGSPSGGGGNREESGCSGSVQGGGFWAFAAAGALLGLAFVRGVAR